MIYLHKIYITCSKLAHTCSTCAFDWLKKGSALPRFTRGRTDFVRAVETELEVALFKDTAGGATKSYAISLL